MLEFLYRRVHNQIIYYQLIFILLFDATKRVEGLKLFLTTNLNDTGELLSRRILRSLHFSSGRMPWKVLFRVTHMIKRIAAM